MGEYANRCGSRKRKYYGFDRNGYTHYYAVERVNLIDQSLNVYDQTIYLLESYENKLKEKNCTLAKIAYAMVLR